MFRMWEGFCFPVSHLVSIFVLEKHDFKKVMLILALFSWRKGRCVCLFVFLLKQAQTIKADFWQFTAVVAQGITVRSEWQAHATSAYTTAFFSHSHSLIMCLCVWMKQREECVFLACSLKEKVLWLIVRGSLSLSVRYVHSEVWKLSDSKEESPRSHTGSF